MQVSENIINYATIRLGLFKKKELAEYLRIGGNLNDASLTTILAKLVATGRLVKTGWGEYDRPKEEKRKWVILPEPETAAFAPPTRLCRQIVYLQTTINFGPVPVN